METSPTAWRLSSRFIAGQTLEQALAICRRIYNDGLTVTLDPLGENVTSVKEANSSRDEALQALDALGASGFEPNVSIKPSQFGMDLDESLCLDNVALAVRQAAARGGFVRVDMESSAYTERTIRLVSDLHARYGSVGAVIQAYLRRSEQDIDSLNEQGVRVRLCKGAYLEPPTMAFEHKPDVDQNFVHLMKKLLDRGTYPAIATHDERMIAQTCAYAASKKIAPDRFEFQMLYGIRRYLQRRLAADGFRVRLYVPYGQAWYPYFMRRLAERPANVLFLMKNLLR